MPSLPMILKVVSHVIGGLALFLFGMRLGANGLQRAAGGRIRTLLGRLAGGPWRGIGFGAVMAVLLQSSSASAVMLVGFVDAGFLALEQAFALLLGAGIGTALTVQAVAFPAIDVALIALAIGVGVDLFARYGRPRAVGRAVAGFALLFVGLDLMKRGVDPLRSSTLLVSLLRDAGGRAVVLTLAAAAFTAVTQSSAATLAMAMALASVPAGGGAAILPTSAVVPVVLGANLGTTATGLLAAIGSGPAGKRVAVGNFLLRLAATVVLLPWAAAFGDLVATATGFVTGATVSPERFVANVHTAYGVLVAVGFAGLVRPLAVVVRRLIPDRASDERGEAVLSPTLLGRPDAALEQAALAVDGLFAATGEMLGGSMRVFDAGSDSLREDVIAADRGVDRRFVALRDYLTRLDRGRMSPGETDREFALLRVASELEQIGDLVARGLMHQVRKLIKQDASFSYEGRHEIRELHRAVVDDAARLRRVVAAWDRRGARAVVSSEEGFSNAVSAALRRHLGRLHEGAAGSAESSAAHLDAVGALERIRHSLTRIARVVLDTPTDPTA